MYNITFTDLHQHLPEYLKQVQQGQEFSITMYGKIIAKLIPHHDANERNAAIQRLEKLRGKMITGDIMAPIDEEWSSDANNL